MGNIVDSNGKPLFQEQPTYEEALAQHPLVPVKTTPPVEDDINTLVAPGVYKRYAEGRKYDSTKNGYVEIDVNEKYENGTYKNWITGRTWNTRLGGYVEDVPPGPPEVGFIE